jgi:hypothetical protein
MKDIRLRAMPRFCEGVILTCLGIYEDYELANPAWHQLKDMMPNSGIDLLTEEVCPEGGRIHATRFRNSVTCTRFNLSTPRAYSPSHNHRIQQVIVNSPLNYQPHFIIRMVPNPDNSIRHLRIPSTRLTTSLGHSTLRG